MTTKAVTKMITKVVMKMTTKTVTKTTIKATSLKMVNILQFTLNLMAIKLLYVTTSIQKNS